MNNLSETANRHFNQTRGKTAANTMPLGQQEGDTACAHGVWPRPGPGSAQNLPEAALKELRPATVRSVDGFTMEPPGHSGPGASAGHFVIWGILHEDSFAADGFPNKMLVLHFIDFLM